MDILINSCFDNKFCFAYEWRRAHQCQFLHTFIHKAKRNLSAYKSNYVRLKDVEANVHENIRADE